MLSADIIAQVKQIFAPLSADISFRLRGPAGTDETRRMRGFLDDVASCSPHLSVEETADDGPDTPRFGIAVGGRDTGVAFRGIPDGHEFSSLLLAVMNASGLGRNLPDESLRRRIAALRGPADLRTFVSLECTNCPDVVQSLNVLALLNPAVSNLTVDGAVEPAQAEEYGVQSVPSVFLGRELVSVGRVGLSDLLLKLEERLGAEAAETAEPEVRTFDAIVAGGGPAGAAAAIYLARKGMHTAVVAGRIGGQVKDTMEIENLISVPLTTGPQLASDLRTHLESNDVALFDTRRIVSADTGGPVKCVTTDSGETFEAPALIIATGASWRRLNVPGEDEYIGRGVAFCTHCDGPFFAGKKVAVVGGGNSGVEAAIDLAAICEQVDVYEFLDTLKADRVLVDKLHTLPNVRVHLSSQLTAMTGDGKRLTGIDVRDRISGAETHVEVQGVFVQIGLTPQSQPFAGAGLDITRGGEIVVDSACRTSVPGVYAAGDVSNVPYKQIVVAMGEGAKAALSAFDDRMRGVTV